MKFVISRTQYNNFLVSPQKPPCEGAIASEPRPYDKGKLYIEWTIEIHSLEELIALAKRVREELILDGESDPPELEIYDDSRE